MTFNPALHGLRSLAALLVLLFHWNGTFPVLGREWMNVPWLGTEWDLFFFVRLGWIGVDWFFVLSGFLLAAGLWHQPINTASTLQFWQRRVVRIYPGAWVHLWVLVLSLYGLGFLSAIPWAQLAANMTLWVVPMPFGAQRLNDVFWTLPLELCFYLSLPFWIWLQRKIGTVQVVLWALAITLVWRLGVVWAHENGYPGPSLGYARYSYPGILFVFMAGFAINHFTKDNTPTLSDRQRWLCLALGLLAYYLW